MSEMDESKLSPKIKNNPEEYVTIGMIQAIRRAEWLEIREAMLPFRSGGDWGKIKAWVVAGSPNTDDARASMKWLTSCQVAVDKALSLESLPKLPECIRNGDLEAWIFSHPDKDERMEQARLELYAFRASLSPPAREEGGRE